MNYEHARMKASFLYFIMVFPMVFSANGCRSEKIRSAKKPNIIIILSDDMGYSDIGCYGGEIKTPVLDELAANGLRFTQFYNAGRCCPTRASLLTGLYPHQASLGHLLNDDGLNGFRGDLGNDCVTISEVLKSAGYANYVSGKWHVTPVYDGEQMTGSSRHNWPLQRGFDRFYGTIHGAGSFWDPNSLVRDNEFISPFADQEYKPMLPEELQTRMIPRKTRDGYPVRMGQEAMPGPSDTYVAYGINWANVSNTPFRMYKHFVHEGGISTPLIAHWPVGIKSINELRHAPTHLIDIMATCVDVSGASYPASYGSKVIQPLEGKSLRSVFENDQMQERHLLFEHENNAAIRKGNWKLVGINVFRNDSVIHKNFELYNIGEDRSELHDLSEIYPEKTSELIDLFVREAYRVRILPSKFGRTK